MASTRLVAKKSVAVPKQDPYAFERGFLPGPFKGGVVVVKIPKRFADLLDADSIEVRPQNEQRVGEKEMSSVLIGVVRQLERMADPKSSSFDPSLGRNTKALYFSFSSSKGLEYQRLESIGKESKNKKNSSGVCLEEDNAPARDYSRLQARRNTTTGNPNLAREHMNGTNPNKGAGPVLGDKKKTVF